LNYSKTAIIVDCRIGKDTKVWHYANLYDCTIGNRCTIGAYVEVGKGVIVGDDVTISSHSYLCELVTVEDDVFLGHGVMTINDIYPPSRKRIGTTSEWRQTRIGRGAVIGSNATLFPVHIGENAIVAAGAVVTKDVKPNTIVAGNPAKVVREKR